jgi:hypothetical protein
VEKIKKAFIILIIHEGGLMLKIKSSEITPESIYLSRRKFMVGIGALAASSALLAACGGQTTPGSGEAPAETEGVEAAGPGSVSTTTDELGDELTPYEAVTIPFYRYLYRMIRQCYDFRHRVCAMTMPDVCTEVHQWAMVGFP